MEILNSILIYFKADPLKILYLLGGSGGLVYWWNLFKNRPRIKVRLFSEELNSVNSTCMKVTSIFEVENIGSTPTSLAPNIIFTGYTPKKERRSKAYPISEEDRSLPPFTPKKFSLVIVEGEYPFLHYRTYFFRVTRGGNKRLRILSANKKKIGNVMHFIGLVRFKMFNKVPT